MAPARSKKGSGRGGHAAGTTSTSAPASASPTRTRFAEHYLYPSGADRPELLTNAEQELKVARHSPCLVGQDEDVDSTEGTPAATCACTGLRPPPGRQVRLKPVKKGHRTKRKQATDDDQQEEEQEEGEAKEKDEEEQSDLSEEPGLPWVRCACGHDVSEHGRIAEEGNEERRRRIKVAVRLDELLEDEDKLLDFDFTNDDINSLRKQILPLASDASLLKSAVAHGRKRKSRSRSHSPAESSGLSSPSQSVMSLSSPDAKRRRVEEEHPQQGTRALADQAAPEISASTAVEDVKKKQEEAQEQAKRDAKDAAPVDAVAKGIAIDVVAHAEEPLPATEQPPAPAKGMEDPGSAPKRERPAVIEERAGLIQFRVVRNDGRHESMILLTGLKNIFQRQLPKMPREYITRLVMDRNHMSMAIVKRGLHVVGGITYRPFNHRKFAEIVFCAITSTEQVKGYGLHLMNHLKDHVRATSPVMHFLTYADNYAIGYFKKQGFTKDISLPRSVWVGYIKDYEGGTLMQCTMVPRVRYLQVQEMLADQKEKVLAKITEISQSHIVHPGLEIFRKGSAQLDPSQVPGLRESGWTPAMDELARRPKRGPHHGVMRQILIELGNHASSWPFQNPVNGEEVTDYYDVIKEPMDLSTMETKLENNKYDTLDQFLADAQLIFDNCRIYNPPSSPYAKSASKLDKFLKDNLQAWKQAGGL